MSRCDASCSAIVPAAARPRSRLPTTHGPMADTWSGLRPIPAASSGGIYSICERGMLHPSSRRRHERCIVRCSRYGPRPRVGRVPAGGFPRLRVVPPAGERARPLRRPSGVLGRRHRDGLEGLRTNLHSARAAVAAIGADCRTVRDAARVADRVLRLGGPGAPGCGGAQALADAGRRGVVSAPGPGAVAGAGHRRGRGPAAGGGAGGGPLDGRAPSQARHLQGERVSGDLGAGAVGGVGARAGARNPCAPGDRISGGRREQGVSGVEGGGDSPRADRGAMVGDGVASPGTDRSGDGCARGHDAAARSAHGIGERKGAGKEPRPGSPGGSRARSPGRPCGRSWEQFDLHTEIQQ